LHQPTAGEVRGRGALVAPHDEAAMRRRRRELQIVFQDPNSSLNPRMTIGQTLEEAIAFHGMAPRGGRTSAAAELLETVGLSRQQANRFPNELSGGQRQRVGIARALALKPKVLVADEPVSALDVSIRAQVINLLMDLQAEFGLTLLFVSHDIGVVAHVSHRIAVMHLGRIVEIGDTDALLDYPAHPYTRALLDAVPVAHPRQKRTRQPLEGDLPSPSNPPPGCPFHPRCPRAIDRCRREIPALRPLGPARDAACHLAEAVVPS
jgi:oligopeptide/dipeptide ABC transporter ATP-binding protein